MKKFLALLLLISVSAQANEQFLLTCPEIYSRTLLKKTLRKEKSANLAGNVQALTIPVVLTGNAPLVSAMLVTGGILGVYGNIDPKEQKIQDMQEEGTRALRKLTKKLRKNVDSRITEEEVAIEVTAGLETGIFCADFPDLYSPRKVKKHVEEVLAEKYR